MPLLSLQEFDGFQAFFSDVMSNKLHTFFHGWNKRTFLVPSDSSAYLPAGGPPAHSRRRCLNSTSLKDGPDSSRDEGCYGYAKTDAPSDRCPAGRAVGIRVRCSGQMGHYHSRAPFNQGVTHPFFTCVGGSSTNTSTSGNNAAAVMSGQMERV